MYKDIFFISHATKFLKYVPLNKYLHKMKTLSIFCLLLLVFLLGCEKGKDNIRDQYEARIVGFDRNCGTCILSFPYDSLNIRNELGGSPDNYYQAVNLGRGNFILGQKLKVDVRKAEDAEPQACITLYPSSNYKYIYVSDFEKYNDLRFTDTIDIAYKDCLNDPDRQIYICLDSVISDSRCPKGGECIWAGEAIARFKIEKYNNKPVYFNLKEGEKEAIISGYHISFIQLLPYPAVGNFPKPEDYKARIVIKNN